MRLRNVAVVAEIGDGTPGKGIKSIEVGFEEFYAGCHEPVLKALALTLGNDELGRDAAAEAMARACQKWHAVSGYENPAGWTYRVGLNWARSRLRKRRREVHAECSQERPDAEPAIIEPRLEWSVEDLADGADDEKLRMPDLVVVNGGLVLVGRDGSLSRHDLF